MRVDDSAQLPKARQFMLQENTSAGGSSRMRELMARLCRADLEESSSADVDAFAVDGDAEEIDNDTHSLVRRVWLPFKLWCLDVLLIVMLGVAGLFGAVREPVDNIALQSDVDIDSARHMNWAQRFQRRCFEIVRLLSCLHLSYDAQNV